MGRQTKRIDEERIEIMNIFFLDKTPEKSAEYLCDKHVVKMILETAQMLSTVAHEYKYHNTPDIYKPTHPNHPMTKWVNTHKNNYLWACEHGLSLCDEYTKRYGKVHKSQKLIQTLHDLCKSVFSFNGGECNSTFITPPPQCMPDQYRNKNYVTAYRNYYKGEKTFAKWEKGRSQPEWWQ